MPKPKFKYMKHTKFNSALCDDSMTFEDCELAILRHAVDKTEELQKREKVNNEDILKILEIVEDFIRSKKLLLYGGTAINNILPENAQFYDRDIEIPDYDMYSTNALEHAKELADLYYSRGYIDVEAKSGVHYGTYKVFVNFISVADITQLNENIFKSLFKDSITRNAMHYTPPNYLRMSMFLELSRPAGDVSRWEKVYKRLMLLNKYYPLKPEVHCNPKKFQRSMKTHLDQQEKLYTIIRDTLIDQGVVFFGGYATSLYSRYMKEHEKHMVSKIPDFDVISENPDKAATIVKENLKMAGFTNIKLKTHAAIGEIIPEHVEVRVENEVMAFIYKPIACHSYNVIEIHNREIRVATIDTILSFYLAFIYIDSKYYDKERLLCMAKFLFDVEQRNRLEQKGLLKRFSINCYGKQQTMEEIRSEKALKFKELVKKRGSKEFESWFLKYIPSTKHKLDTKKIEEAEQARKLGEPVVITENSEPVTDEEKVEEPNAANDTKNTPTKVPIRKSKKKPRKTLKQIRNRVRERITRKQSDFLV